MIAAAALIAACGSSPNHRSRTAASGGVTNQALANQMVKFADCMRDHGVPSFPDPNTDPYAFKQAFSDTSPAFKSAVTSCGHLLPRGQAQSQSPTRTHAQIEAFLAFAGCMRSHGFPHFPDPTASGQITHQMIAAAGISLDQPAVRQAGDTCTRVTHGFITKTMVAQFVAGQ